MPGLVEGRGVGEDMRQQLAEGRRSVRAVGAGGKGETSDLPFVVVDGEGGPLEPVVAYLRDLMLGAASPLTCRSYGFDLLRWHRLLWFLGIEWDRATEADVATLVAWLRAARNPQRQRSRPGSRPAGAGDLKTGKPPPRGGDGPP